MEHGISYWYITLNAGPMTIESSFPLIFNFATLYVDKAQSLHFKQMKECIYYELSNFHEFC